MLSEEDLVSTLDELGYPLKKSGKYYQTAALYRGGDDTTSIAIYPESDYVIDFVTGQGFTIKSFLCQALKLDSSGIEDWVKTKKFRINNAKPRPEIKQSDIFSHDILKRLLPNHDYWLNRGIKEETLIQFRGGLMLESGRMFKRYVLPIFNSKLDIVGFTGRDITDKSLAKHKIIGDKSNFVWPAFLNRKILKIKKEVILVESPGCVLKLWDNDIKHTLCLFGIKVSNRIIKYLLSLDVNKVYISTNNEPDNKGIGNKAALKIKERLLEFFDSKQVIIELPPNKDWALCSANDIPESFKL